MHIPKSFGGGFVHHNIVHEKNVEKMYQHYTNLKNKNGINSFNISYPNNIINKGEEAEKEFFIVFNKSENERKKKNWWW